MDVLNELFRASLGLGMVFRILGGCRCDGSFVVEAVEVAASLLEILYPFLRLEHSMKLAIDSLGSK